MKNTIKFLGLVFLLSEYVTMTWLFIGIYFTPTFTGIIHINTYGEAHIELIMLLISIPMVLLFTVITICEIVGRKRYGRDSIG